MTQTSRLVLEIDSRDAEQKAEDVRKALGALEAAGLRVKPAMDQAGSGIDGAGSSARKAAGSIDGLADSSSKSSEASKRTAETFGQASNRLLEMAKSSLQASEYIKAMSASTEKAGAAFDVASTKAASLAALEKRLREESDANVGANGRMADASKKSTIATQEQATALANLLGRIDPVSRKLAELDKQEQELQRHRKSGTSGLDTETFKTYQATIDKNRAALGGFNSDLKQTGVSASQTQTALRQLPSQFTDIFTSIAGGQNPLLVLIQQGGQIKDSFGGIDNTVEALGKKVKGFFSSIIGSAGGITGAGIALGELASQQNAVAQGSEAAAEGLGGVAEGANTATDAVKNAKDAAAALASGAGGAGTSLLAIVGAATAAAAAIGLLIYGYNKGSQEADAFNQALTLTGNAAGTSSGALGSMARRISDATGTVGAAAAVLAQLASSSKIPASSFEMIATAALKLQDATGQAASKTVDDFEKIAKDPVKYSKELNDQLGYLTGSTYAQIDALVKQGDQQGAATLAEKAYAEALGERADSIKGKLGLIEGAWDGVKDAAKGAWDAVLDVGREDTFEQKLIKLEDRLQSIRNAKVMPSLFSDNPDLMELSGGESAAQSEITGLYVQKAEDERRAAAKADVIRLNKESIASQEKLNEALTSTSSNAVKLKARYAEIEKQVEAARLTGKAYSEEQIKQLKDAAAKQFGGPKPKEYQENAGQKMLDQARQQYSVLQQQNALIGQQGDGAKVLGAEAKRLLELEQQIADLKQKKTLTTAQKQILAMADLNVAQQKQNAALEKQNELKKISTQQTQKLLAFQENLNSQLSLAQSGLDQKLAGAGLGDKALQRLQEQQQIQQSYQSQMDRLTYDYNKSDKTAGSTQLYNQETEALRSALGQRLAMQQGYYVAVDKAQSDWTIGASSAFQTYAEQAKDVAGQTRELFTRAFTNMEDAVVNFVRTGKLSFKDFANGVIEDLIRIQVRQAAAGFLSSAFSAFSGAGAATAGAGTAASAGSTAAGYSSQYGFSDGGFTGAGGKFEPKGVVHGGEFVIRKEVVDQPGMREYLERMNANSNGYADGGYVNPTSAAATTNVTRGASSDGSAPNIIQQFSFQGTPDDSTISLVKDAAYQGAKGGYEMVMRDLKQNGPIRQLIARR
ncbi:phage tail tape measure protein [Pseudomonas prosekii]|uniref:Phage tail tape measure protein, lambda family n=1 Tax=Pseudomonas prosekii TaxID=1148509 RepID=A0A1H2B4K2_9PSED|nr:phage tail tape measure protein [Pseudomonas prosekii]SDT52869.1 phage tail tape measure protein, lambda family [Pseudomonas prosekii]